MGIPDHALLQRVAAIEAPVFVANGDSDPMILALVTLGTCSPGVGRGQRILTCAPART